MAKAKAKTEKRIMHEIMRAMSDAGSRLFRNTVGLAFQGKPERFHETATIQVHRGDVLIRNARTVTVGLFTGSSDLVGWTTRMITEHDLGKTIAQFTACEVKSEDGVIEPEQKQFLDVVLDSGGVAIVARSAEEAVHRLKHGGPIE